MEAPWIQALMGFIWPEVDMYHRDTYKVVTTGFQYVEINLFNSFYSNASIKTYLMYEGLKVSFLYYWIWSATKGHSWI